MQQNGYTIRPMTRPEIDLAVEWAAAEGWNPGLHDAGSFHAADPEGFLVGLLDGEPVATISGVRYGQDFGFIGFYIVKPTYRGQGYGLHIWNAAMQRLAGRTVGLDGVVAQQDNYRKSGFALAWNNARYEGVGGGARSADDAIVPLATVPFEALDAYDQAFFPDDRRAFLRAWIGQPGAAALGLVQDGRLAGYGVLRPCRSGFWLIRAGRSPTLDTWTPPSCTPSRTRTSCTSLTGGTPGSSPSSRPCRAFFRCNRPDWRWKT